MNIDKIRNAEDYVLANKHLMELLTYSQRVEQKIFEKILHKNIKDKKSCIYCMPNTLFGGRGFGKSYLVLKLASEYNLPVVVNIESRAEQLRQDSKRYVRVYDPRGFEFEITVPNLLWILENSDCIKGKGLAGEFVYGWDGAELLLVPVDSPEYKESQKISIAKFSKTFIKGKDLIVGHTYKFTNGEQYVYLGKYDFYDSVRDPDSGRFGRINAKIGKRFFFGYEGSGPHNTVVPQISIPKSLTRLVTEETSDIMSDQYADYVSLMKKNPHFSPEDISKDKFVPFAVNEIMGLLFKECPWNPPYRYPLHNLLRMFVRRNDGTITHVCLRYITKADTSTQFPEWKNPDAPIYYVTNGDYDYTPALNIDDFVADTFETLYTNPVYSWQTKKVWGYKERPVTLTELLNHFTPVWHYTYLTNGEFYKKEFFNDNYDFDE